MRSTIALRTAVALGGLAAALSLSACDGITINFGEDEGSTPAAQNSLGTQRKEKPLLARIYCDCSIFPVPSFYDNPAKAGCKAKLCKFYREKLPTSSEPARRANRSYCSIRREATACAE